VEGTNGIGAQKKTNRLKKKKEAGLKKSTADTLTSRGVGLYASGINKANKQTTENACAAVRAWLAAGWILLWCTRQLSCLKLGFIFNRRS
jgi:hypothetical protein